MIVIVGETGSGKSAAAVALAKEHNGEIINADSWAVYRGFDIGTAKPAEQERKSVPHHLLDVADPLAGFNAALYKELANQAITDIQSRGRLPVLVGGTGLYIDSVVYDYQFLPSVTSDTRESRNIKTIEQLLSEAEEANVDLSNIDIRNKRRIVRALESGGRSPSRSEMRPGTLIFGIVTARDTLLTRVTERVNTMIEEGLEQEVSDLAKKYGWDIEPMKGIGYIEWREHFEGSQDIEQTKRRIISGTMRLAKKQRTWFKRNPQIHWVDNTDKISNYIYNRLNEDKFV